MIGVEDRFEQNAEKERKDESSVDIVFTIKFASTDNYHWEARPDEHFSNDQVAQIVDWHEICDDEEEKDQALQLYISWRGIHLERLLIHVT